MVSRPLMHFCCTSSVNFDKGIVASTTHFRRNMKQALVGIFAATLFSIASGAGATTRYTTGTYVSISAQSLSESSAHWIATSVDTVYCDYDRLYIDPQNKELFATALSASLNNKQVNVAFDDNSPSVSVPPHGSITCKVLSIWWDN